MPTEELVVKIEADASDLKRGLGEAKRSVGGFSGELENLAVVAGAAFGAREVFEFLKSTVNEASAAEEASIKLAAALRAQGITSKKSADDILAFSSAMQASSRYNDEAVTDAQRLLVSLGRLSGEGLQNATRATLDLAAGLGIDLQSAALLVGKAAAGSTSAFSRYGLVVKNTGDKAKDFAGILEQIQTKFGGSATAQVEGYAGATAQLGNSFSDLKESIGGAMLPALEDVAKGIKTVIDSANDDSAGLSRFVLAVLTLGNSEALRAFNNLKKDGGLLGDDTNLSLASARVNELEAAMARVVERRKDLLRQQQESGDPLTNTTGINKATEELDALTAEWEAAVAARDRYAGNDKPITTVDPEEVARVKKLRDAWIQAWEARLGAGADFAQDDIDAERAAFEAWLADWEAGRESMDELEAQQHDDRMAEIEERLQAISDLNQEGLDEEGHKRAIQQSAERRTQIQLEQEAYQTLGSAVTGVFQDVAFEGEDMGEAVKNALRGIAMDLVRIAIARIIANAGVTGSNVAARESTTSGVAGVAVGLASAAAIAALAGKIPAFHEGGVVGGPLGRDPSIIKAERGERVLSRKQNAAFESGQMGGGSTFNFTFSSVLPPDQAQLREVLRTTIMPELANLQRQRMI